MSSFRNPLWRPRGAARRVFDARPHQLTATVVPTRTGQYTRLAGRAAPYNVFTPRWWYHLAIAPGGFDKTLSEHGAGLPLLLFHDSQRFPIGRAAQWDAAGDGLDGLWDLDNSAQAQEAARLADEGYMTGLSVGITAIQSEWEYTSYEDWEPGDATTWDKCTVIEARLDEVSLTPTPGYQEARVAYSLERTHRRGQGAPGGRHADMRPHAAAAAAWLDTIR